MFSSTFLLETSCVFCACLSSRIELLQSAKVIAVFGFGCGQRPRHASVFQTCSCALNKEGETQRHGEHRAAGIEDDEKSRGPRAMIARFVTDRCLAGDSVCGARRQGDRRKQRGGEDGTSLFTLFISVSSVSSCKKLPAFWFPGHRQSGSARTVVIAGLQYRGTEMLRAR